MTTPMTTTAPEQLLISPRSEPDARLTKLLSEIEYKMYEIAHGSTEEGQTMTLVWVSPNEYRLNVYTNTHRWISSDTVLKTNDRYKAFRELHGRSVREKVLYRF